jgi:hypothetical protein
MVERDDLTDENKRNIFGGNARRCYAGLAEAETAQFQSTVTQQPA